MRYFVYTCIRIRTCMVRMRMHENIPTCAFVQYAIHVHVQRYVQTCLRRGRADTKHRHKCLTEKQRSNTHTHTHTHMPTRIQHTLSSLSTPLSLLFLSSRCTKNFLNLSASCLNFEFSSSNCNQCPSLHKSKFIFYSSTSIRAPRD
jgi:hypothetical protein